MNVETIIKPEFWHEIENAYNSGKYSYAILDAIHYLTYTIRDKSNLDGDGESLIGQAFGGNHPKVRINKFQTQSEQDEQRGFTQILLGLYKGIRNPRSHEPIEDSQKTADAIIIFINYLLDVLDKSQEPFSLSKFLSTAFDEDFFRSNRYAELLVDQIPANKRFDTLIEIFRRKLDGNCENLFYLVSDLLSKLTVAQMDEFLQIVSAELLSTRNDNEISHIICMLPNNLWPYLEETSRLRVENKLYKSIDHGVYDDIADSTNEPLGTRAGTLFQHFQDKARFGYLMINKLKKNYSESSYVGKYLLTDLPEVCVFTYLENTCIELLCEGILNEHQLLMAEILNKIYRLPENWKKMIIEILENSKSINSSYLCELKAEAYPPF